MTSQLEELNEDYDRANQDTKREMGISLYNRPARWIAKQELADEFDIDPSVVGRHLDDFYEDGYIVSQKREGQRYVQWKGRGAGGIRYWANEVIPQQLWMAGSELRPFLKLDSLGGAYLPTILFGLLMIVGLITGVLAFIIETLPTTSVFGITTFDLVVLTGLITMFASMFLFTAPLAHLFELTLVRFWKWAVDGNQDRNNGD